MKREPGSRGGTDSPLANSDFFRQVESLDRTDPSVEQPEELSELEEALAEIDADEEPEAAPEPFEDFEADDYPEPTPAHRPDPGGRGAIVAGWVLGTTGAMLAAATQIAPESVAGLSTALAEAGLQAIHFVAMGLALALFGSLRSELARRSAAQQHDFARLDEAIERIEATAHEQRERREEEELSESERVLLALERQDGKINNLTRATKLYGKPLVEISKQVGEVANQVQDLATLADDVRSANESAQRVLVKLGELEKALVERVREALAEDGEETRALLSRQESALAEVARSLETGTEPMRTLDEQLGRVDERMEGLTRSTAALREGVEGLPSLLEEKLAAIDHADRQGDAPTVDLTPIERSLDALNRELQRIGTRLAQLETRPAGTTPQSATPPTPAPAADTGTPSAPAKDSPGPASGLAHSISGERQSGSKNVLGAIAKLKSMRG